MDKQQAATPVPYEHDISRFCNLIIFHVQLSIGFIITFAAEEKEVIAQHIFIEILFHLLLNAIIEIHFGKTSKAAMLINVVRNIIFSINSAFIHMIAGKNASTWLWHFQSVLALALLYDCCSNPIWVTIITILKIIQCFIVMHIFGGRTFYETLSMTYMLAIVAMTFNVIIFSMKMNQKGLKQVNKHITYQFKILNSILNSISDTVIRVNTNFVIEFIQDKILQPFSTAEYIGKPLWDVLIEKETQIITKKHLRTVFDTGKPSSWRFYCQQFNKHFSATASVITSHKKPIAATLLITDVTETTFAQVQKEEAKKMDIKLKAKSEFISQISHELKNPLQAINYSIELLSKTELNHTQKELVENIQQSQQLLISILGNVLDISKLESGTLQLIEAPMSILSVIETIGDVFYSMAVKKGLQLITYCDPNLPIQCMGDATRISQILSNFVSNAIKFTPKGYVLLSAELEKKKNSEISVQFCCKDSGVGISKANREKIFKRFVQLPKEEQTYQSGWGLGLSISKGIADLLKGRIHLESEPGSGCKFSFHVDLKLLADKQSITSTLQPSPQKNVLLSLSNPIQKEVLSKYLKVLGVEKIVDSYKKDLQPFLTITDSLESTNWESSHKVLVVKPESNDTPQSEIKYPNNVIFLNQPVKLHTLIQFLGSEIIKEGVVQEHKKLHSFFDSVPVLVVEDNPVVRALIRKALSTFGISQIETASNGLEAVEKLKKATHPYGIIFMDIHMPILDGYEAAQRIRKICNERNWNTPIIAVSGESDEKCYEKCTSHGMNEVISKPVTTERLMYAIQKYSNV